MTERREPVDPPDTPVNFSLGKQRFVLGPCTVYDGLSPDAQPRLVKRPTADFALLVGESVAYEFRLGREADLAGVLKPVDLIETPQAMYGVFEPFGGNPLTAMAGRASVGAAVDVGRRLCRAIQRLHDHKIIHRQINPSSVLFDPASADLRLTDLSCAKVDAPGIDPPLPVAFGPTSAPEQSGQVTLAEGVWTDLYGLGSVLYFLLSGRLPHRAGDLPQLVHSVISEAPEPLTKLCPGLSPGLDALVSRLLAKNPYDRPARAADVASELDTLDRRGPPVSTGGISPPILQCNRAFGREREIEALVGFCRAADAETRVVWMSGEAGIGKSRLLEILRQQVRTKTNLFAYAKFDQIRSGRPNGAFLDAIANVLDNALGAHQSVVAAWSKALRTIEAPLLSVLVQQLPVLGHFVGKRPRPLPLGPAETRNRQTGAMFALLEVLATERHPLTLVIDDCQWADDASATALATLIADGRQDYLTIVLAYRPDDSGIRTPEQRRLLDESHGCTATHIRIDLPPLADSALASLCEHALGPCEHLSAVAALTCRHARGNPLIALEVLRSLQRARLLTWERADTYRWVLSPSAEARFTLSDSLADFVVKRLEQLSAGCRHVLSAASRVGHTFRFDELMGVLSDPEADVRDALAEARDEQLVTLVQVPQHGTWHRFAHDRIQQAASERCTNELRLHWDRTLGFDLMRRTPLERADAFRASECLIDIDILDPEERLEVAQLYRQAGDWAKQEGAHERGARWFSRAAELYAQLSDAHAHDVFECRLQLAECLFPIGRLEASEALLDELRQSVPLDAKSERALAIERTSILLCLHSFRYGDAISHALNALRLRDFRFPRRPGPIAIGANLLAVRRGLRRESKGAARSPPDAPPLDPIAADIMGMLTTAAFWDANGAFNLFLGSELMKMALRDPTNAHAPIGYMYWMIMNRVLFGNPALAVRLGRRAEEALGSQPDSTVISEVQFAVTTFVGTLMRDNRDNVAAHERAYVDSLNRGENLFAGHCIDAISVALPFSQFRLPEIESTLERWEVRAARIQQSTSVELIRLVGIWCRTEIGTLTREANEQLRAELFEAGPKNPASLPLDRFWSFLSTYLAGEYDAALSIGRRLRKDIPITRSNPVLEGMYITLMVLLLCGRPGRPRTRKIRSLIRRLGVLASVFRPNFRSSLLLAEGAWAFRRGRSKQAATTLRNAIAEAVEQGHDLVRAIACERLAELYEAESDTTQHRAFLSAAAYSFGRWGAMSRVRQLSEKYPNELTRESIASDSSPSLQPTEVKTSTILRSIDAIAEESDTDALAARLLRLMTTNTGAQAAGLFRDVDGELRLAAWIGGSSDTADAVLGERLDESRLVPLSVARYAIRTNRAVDLVRPASDPRFDGDEYLRVHQPRAILCTPLLHRGQISALVYLEKRREDAAFDETHRQIVQIVGRQAAVSLAMANHYKLQVEAVQARINPHFLYNTLSVVAELVFKDPEGAEAALITLSRLYRYLLGSSPTQRVSLAEELRITRDYLSIEQYRFGTRLSVEVEVVGQIDDIDVPALLLQPLVENSVRHGVARKTDPGRVSIYIMREHSHCTVQVSDDGPGLAAGSKGHGFGLRSVRQRLDLLYGDTYTLDIDSRDGYTVVIRFPSPVVSP